MLQSELETTKPRERIWGIWQTIGFGLVIFTAYLLLQMAVAYIYFRIKLLSDPNLDSSTLADNISSDGLLLALATIASTVAGIGLIILFVKLRKGSSVKDYLGLKRITVRQVLAMIGIYVGLIILSGIVASIIGDSKDSEFTTEVYKTSVWPVLFGIAVVVFAPAFEEAFFRGFLFVGLRQSPVGTFGAVVLTALMWSMIHLQYEFRGIAVIFVLGIVLGIVRYKTGSLVCNYVTFSLEPVCSDRNGSLRKWPLNNPPLYIMIIISCSARCGCNCGIIIRGGSEQL